MNDISGQMIKWFDGLIKKTDKIYLTNKIDWYWSNLSKEQNTKLMAMLETLNTKKCIEDTNPKLVDVIFSEKRAAALELLQLKGTESVVDLGCI